MMKYEDFFLCFGVTNLKVSTNYLPYQRYIRNYFNRILSSWLDKYDLEIKISWERNFLEKLNEFIKKEQIYSIGANTFLGEKKLITLRKVFKRQKIIFNLTLKNNSLLLEAILPYKGLKDKIRHSIFGRSLEEYFFELSYYLIYYPLFLYLEYFKDIHIIHASAVRLSDKNLVICALEGMGKTTFSLNFTKEKAIFISDNLIFYDKKNIYPCFEAIRIYKGEEKNLGKENFKKIANFKSSKEFYEPTSFNLDTDAKSSIFIIPVFASTFFIKELSVDEFANRVLNYNQLTAELGNYNEFASLFSLLDLNFDILEKRKTSLKENLSKGRCFEVGMVKSEGVEKNFYRFRKFIMEL